VNALAIMPVRNERDILPWSVAHLIRQGVSVYVVDNWSTDGSWEMLPNLGLVGFERFPGLGPDDKYNFAAMLRRIDFLAAASGADWCCFHDSDEIRRSPRPGETLVTGFARVEAEGFNAVNHRCYLFQPTLEGYCGDPEAFFQHYTTAHIDCRLNHVKAWKNPGRLIGLGDRAAAGGHRMNFSGMRVHPEKWILKHYPIRGQAHGARKVAERAVRLNTEERSWGWHQQYKGLTESSNFIHDPATLMRWVEEAAA
jgi:hypothetical protein